MKQSYTASADLMGIFGTILGDKMLWNLLIKGLFHHLHYIPKMQLNLINEQLSSRISQLQHKQIQQRELALEIQSVYNGNGNNKKRLQQQQHHNKTINDDSDDDDDSNKLSISSKCTKNKKTKATQNSLVLLSSLM